MTGYGVNFIHNKNQRYVVFLYPKVITLPISLTRYLAMITFH